MQALGFDLREQATLETLTSGVIETSAVEGEVLNPQAVRSSIAWRLGIGDDATGTVANALFRSEEDTRGYPLLTEGIIGLSGIPLPSTVNSTVSSGSMTRPGDKARYASQQVASTRRATRPHGPARSPGCVPNRPHGK